MSSLAAVLAGFARKQSRYNFFTLIRGLLYKGFPAFWWGCKVKFFMVETIGFEFFWRGLAEKWGSISRRREEGVGL